MPLMNIQGQAANIQPGGIGHTKEDLAGIQPGTGPSRYGAGGVPTPADYLDRSMQQEMEIVNEKYRKQWDQVQQHVKYLGPEKAQGMLSQLMLQGQNEVAQVRAKSQRRADMLTRIGNLRDQGALGDDVDTERLMWETAGGNELADVMFPKPEKPPTPIDPMVEFGRLSTHENRLEKEISDEFNVTTVGQWWKPKKYEKKKIQRWIPELGEFVDAPEQGKAFAELAQQQAELALTRSARKRLGQSSGMAARVMRSSARLVTGENPRGTLGDRVNAVINLNVPITTGQKLDKETAQAIMREAGGDKNKARQIAKQRGYKF